MNTMQQEFDAVVAHLYAQGRPAKSDGSCVYRAGELSCAVGCRIPDEMYTREMEYKNVTLLLECQPDYDYQLPPEIAAYKEMFLSLQRVHDTWYCSSNGVWTTDDLAFRLLTVANEFGLTFTVPETK